MHIHIIENSNHRELQGEVNKFISDLMRLTPIQRDFTEILDIKFTSTVYKYTAMIILGEK